MINHNVTFKPPNHVQMKITHVIRSSSVSLEQRLDSLRFWVDLNINRKVTEFIIMIKSFFRALNNPITTFMLQKSY